MKTSTVVSAGFVISVACTTLFACATYYTWDKDPYVDGNAACSHSVKQTYKARAKVQKWNMQNGEPKKSGPPVEVTPVAASQSGGFRWVAYVDVQHDDTMTATSNKFTDTVVTQFQQPGTGGLNSPYKAKVRPTGESTDKQQKYSAPEKNSDGTTLTKDNIVTPALEVTVS